MSTASKKTVKASAPVAAPVAAPATPAVESKPAAKKATKVEAAAPVATPAPVKVEAAAPAKVAEKPAAKKAVVAKDEASVAPSVATATTVATGTEATTVTAASAELFSFESMRSRAHALITEGKALLEEVKAAEKAYAKQVKLAQQGNKKRRRTSDDSASRTNSVFMQPKKISAELAGFLGVTAETLVCRTDATRKIGAYVKEHNLQNPENRREINADAKLTKLFGLTSADKLTYFNLQRYLKPHFPKA